MLATAMAVMRAHRAVVAGPIPMPVHPGLAKVAWMQSGRLATLRLWRLVAAATVIAATARARVGCA